MFMYQLIIEIFSYNMMTSNRWRHNNKIKHSHVLIIIIIIMLSFLFQCGVNSSTNSTTNSTILGNQLLVAKVVDKQIKCIDMERNALLDFKAGLQDPFGDGCISAWGTIKEAVDDDDCCSWRGVRCNNQTGHVTELDLNGCGLKGEVSPSLLNLTHLTLLNLSWNGFYRTIPSFIGSMTRLRYLDINYNSFDGSHETILEDIGSLTELRHLSLSGNLINGTIPNSIGSLTKLRYLDLSANFFNETIPGSIGSLTELQYLDFSQNSFNGSIPGSIGSLTKLRFLDLSSNSFHGSIPMSLGNLTELRNLNLFSNSFSGNIPAELGNLVNLEELFLFDIGRCSAEDISWVSRLSRLEILRLDGISLAKADHWVNAVLNLQNLTLLSLDGCDLSQVMHPYYSSSSHDDSSSSSNINRLSLCDNNLNSSMYPWFYPLTRSNRLEYLRLDGNKLDKIPSYFGNLCHLTELYFENNSALVTFSDFLKTLSTGCTSYSLIYLEASSSQFTGSISDDIQNFSSLQILMLDHNRLNGTISEKMLELPMLGSLDVSFNSLKGATFELIGKSTLGYIDLSNNLLEEFRFKTHNSSLNNAGYIDLSFCKLGVRFPKWIQTFKNLTSLYHLNMANNGISYTVPSDFWDTLPSLENLNLSSNNISGKASNLLSFYSLYVLDLSSNSFYGPIMNVSSTLIVLNLSKNKFYGGISFLCQNVDWSITYIDLSRNSFSGQIPDCLWHLKSLRVLNLAHNNLSGRLPRSVEYLVQLEVLDLYSNIFSGELPLSLRNCTMLNLLDLGANKFSGNLPIWIGENLSGLYVLSLDANDFFGSIPLQLCQLVNLQILDLSMNNLNGTIPSCFNNLTSMVQQGFLSAHNLHEYEFPTHSPAMGSGYYTDQGMVQWQGIGREFTSNLRLLKYIDLSSNNLTGEIPNELTDLHGLLALNLSKNGLLGEIPHKIGQMKEIQILDLSHNNLSGGLPSTMYGLSFLNYLDVSYNNLSGRIPPSTQLQSFGPPSYIGNAGLCGPPLLTKSCLGDEGLGPYVVGETEGGGEGDIDERERWFYIGGAVGFAIGFWIVCITLLVIRRGRRTFFHFLDALEDWVYVKVSVFKAKFE